MSEQQNPQVPNQFEFVEPNKVSEVAGLYDALIEELQMQLTEYMAGLSRRRWITDEQRDLVIGSILLTTSDRLKMGGIVGALLRFSSPDGKLSVELPNMDSSIAWSFELGLINHIEPGEVVLTDDGERILRALWLAQSAFEKEAAMTPFERIADQVRIRLRDIEKLELDVSGTPTNQAAARKLESEVRRLVERMNGGFKEVSTSPVPNVPDQRQTMALERIADSLEILVRRGQ